ncbi:MAG: hypothetical protein PHH26_04810 [Candidatus Thermoplasmatota archaeon]|nr:hypothetical protein [Candidatus Thermoplasmatota archaeon]
MNGSKNGKAKLFAIGIGAFALMVVLLMLASHASAQTATQTEVIVSAPPGNLKPITDIMPLTVTVKYQWPNVGGTGSVMGTPTTIKLTAVPQGDAINWCTASINPAQVYINLGATPMQGGQQTATATLTIHVTGDAPASATPLIKVTAEAQANGFNGMGLESSSGSYDVQIGIGYYSLLQATVPQTLQKGAPYQQITYPVTVTNLGNGKTKIFFDVKNVPTGWQVTLPSPIILESRQQGGKLTQQTVNVVVFTPYKTGYQNNVGSIRIDVTSKYADDTTIVGDATSINTLTLSKGFYVPGFDAILMFGAIGLVSLLLRRKK